MAAMEQFESRSSRIRLDLPDELVAEILLRMPAKSIARFRCVSTTWLSISTDPSFIRAHARRSPNSVFVCSTKKTNLESFGRDLLSFSATGIIERRLEQIDGVAISSCDGLTLFLKESIHQFYVMNLATGLHIDLPYLNTNDKFDRVSELYYHRWTREYRCGLIDIEGKLCCWTTYLNKRRKKNIMIYIWADVDGEEKWMRAYSLCSTDIDKWCGYIHGLFYIKEREQLFSIESEDKILYLFAWDLKSGKFQINHLPLGFNVQICRSLICKETLFNRPLGRTGTDITS